MLDCITGFQRPDRGAVILEGRDIGGRASWQIARAGLMRAFQNVRVYEQMSLLDNLLVACRLSTKPTRSTRCFAPAGCARRRAPPKRARPS